MARIPQKPLLGRTNLSKHQAFHSKLLIACAILAVVSIITCSYGYAALRTDLLIAGDATIKATNAFNIKCMQEMTPAVCAQAEPLATAQLIDERDDKTYWVTKLPDGKCWMTQNLDYDGGGTRFTARSDFSKWKSEESSTPKQYYYGGDNAKGYESEGSYYSYFASTTVCPSGWKLPTGKEYQDLFSGSDFYGSPSNKTRIAQESPYYFRLSGWVRGDDGLVGVGAYANYGEARSAGNSAAYIAVFSNDMFELMGQNDFFYGSSVRCVAGEPVDELQDMMIIDKMQDLTPQLCMNTSPDTTKRLVDTRDNHKYWVTKLQDGNCWMTQNLDYNGGGKHITDVLLEQWSITGQPTQYYYRGDWQDGRDSLGTLYSWKSALSVCPAGWRLLTGGPNGEIAALWSTIGSGASLINALRASPYYFVAAGYATNTTSILQVGTEGYWWSSDGVSSDTAYAAFYHRPSTETAYSEEGTYFGESVRCLVPGAN